jgi:hypothetical protein
MSNLCSMLVQLKQDLVSQELDEHVKKKDVCDMVDARIGQLVKQLLNAPYSTNFSFDIDRPHEQDKFDRAALYTMEVSDDVAPP